MIIHSIIDWCCCLLFGISFLLLVAADSIGQNHILQEVIDAVDQAVLLTDYDNLEPEQCAKLLASVSVIKGSLGDLLEVDSAINELSKSSGSLRFIAHGIQNSLAPPRSTISENGAVDESLRSLLQVVNFPDAGLAARLDEVLDDPDRTDEILEPINRLQIEQLSASMARNQEILNRYAKKFGPGSVQLNPLETLLNFAFQSVPGFGPSKLGSPGALELIAAYNTGYLSYGSQDEDFNVIAAAELGIRFYFLQAGWGEGSPFTPRYASAGFLISGQDDGALITPWQGEASRFGGFVSWGDYKFAFLSGDQSRFLFTRQFQFLNHLF